MTITDKQAATARALLKQYEVEQHDKRKRKLIPCAACDGRHQIGKLDAINTHWYVRPSGCTDGDYWVEGDIHFVCPETGIRNRLYFSDCYDARKAGVDAGEAFKRKYRDAFKSMTPEHEHDNPIAGKSYRWVNNEHMNKHRREWGLPEYVPTIPGKAVVNE